MDKKIVQLYLSENTAKILKESCEIQLEKLEGENFKNLIVNDHPFEKALIGEEIILLQNIINTLKENEDGKTFWKLI